MNTIFSYYEHCDARNMEEEIRLILLWREHHDRLGIRTIVLSEAHARKNPDFPGYKAAIDTLTENTRSDSRPCFMRWLAMAELGGVLMQYNTFLYPQVADDLNPIFEPDLANNVIGIFSGMMRPALVAGSKVAYKLQAGRFATCRVKQNSAIIGDSDILAAQHRAMPEVMSLIPLVKDYGEPDWNRATAVRYPRNLLLREGFASVWRAVPDIRKYSAPNHT